MGLGKVMSVDSLKYFLLFFNFISWIFGVSIFALSLWIRFDHDFQRWVQELGLYDYWAGNYILMGTSVLVMIISFFGCCGAFLENRCMLGTFAGLLGLCFVCELAGSAYMLDHGIQYSQLDTYLNRVFTNGIYQYDYNPRAAIMMNSIQEYVNCCGANNALDYARVHKKVPNSCRNPITGSEWSRGCVEGFSLYVQKMTGWICGIALVLCVLQIGGIIASILLARKIKEEDEQYAQ